MILSCVREELPNHNQAGIDKIAEVSLDLFVAREIGEAPETKVIDDPADATSTVIRNLNIIQYDGTDDDSRIVGEVTYLSDTADPDDEEKYLNPKKIRLADSQGKKHTLVILANTFTKLPQVETLGEMKSLFRTLDSNYEVFGYEGDGLDFPDKGETQYYQRLNAIAVTTIENGTIIKGALRRSMAKINIHIENDGTDALKIKSIQLMNVSKKDYYITDYSYIDQETDEIETLYEDTFQDSYEPGNPKRMNYEVMEWNGNSDGTGAADYTFYVPANQRGIDEANLLPQEKNRCPNADGATYVKIKGTYGDSEENQIAYTFYLGGNLYNDFNICPNTIYNYNFTFSGKGDSIVDDRIEDMGTIDFDVDANCYILNPPTSNARSYTFNVIHRPNIFWGSRYGLEAEYPNYRIDKTKEWKAFVLWSDFEMTKEEVNNFLVRKNGNGSDGYMSSAQRVKVRVPAGMKHGNVVIGMYVDDPENIMWSWHLWITDYRPMDIERHAPIDGKYVYPVEGGEVHRYAGSSWTNDAGRYRNGYAMDRNLGALDIFNHIGKTGGGMVYQFGRKDPFVGEICPYWTYDIYGNPTKVTKTDPLPYVNKNTPEIMANNGANVPFSVNHPTLIIGDGGGPSWHFNDQFNPAENTESIEWNDPQNTECKENEELGANADKSIFDPCPNGWRLPRDSKNPLDDCYEGFNDDNKETSTTNPDVNFVRGVALYSKDDGYIYFPEGGYLTVREYPNPQTVFFPFAGVRGTGGGYVSPFSWRGWYWTATATSQTQASTLIVPRWTAGGAGTYYRTYACPVRCVKENYLN